VTEDTGLAPRYGKRTANRDIRHNTYGSLSSGDDENDSISDNDDIMSTPNLSKQKARYASLQQGMRRVKASLSGAKMEVKQSKKQYDQSARQVLVLKTALDNARAETKDHCCVASELQASLAENAGLKVDLSKEQHTLKQLTDQFNSKAKEYDRLGLHLMATTTKYRDALLELKSTEEDIAKLSIDLIVAVNMVSENALFTEHVKEELYVTDTDLMTANEETAIV
jgi:predicted RNase H-like nuclease (RuvC/YqgF family)